MSLAASSLAAAETNTPPWDVVPTPNRDSGGNDLRSVTALSPNDAWAVGPGGPSWLTRTTLTQHWDGTSWTIVPSPEPAGSASSRLNGVSGTSSDDVWAVGGHNTSGGAVEPLIEHWDGTAWSIVDNPPGTIGELGDVEVVSANDAWAVGESGSGSIILRWNGTRWSATANPCSFNLHAVDAVTADDVWAVGYQHTCHWDGRAWSKVTVAPYDQTTFIDVSGAAPDSVWAVSSTTECPYDCTSYSSIWHWNGTSWTTSRTFYYGNETLSGIEVAPSGRIYAVGARFGWKALVLVLDGARWRDAPFPDVAGWLSSVSSSPAGDLWAVGQTTDSGPPRSFAERAPAPASGGVIGDTGHSGATVSWFGAESGSTATDDGGQYAVGGLKPGNYQLIATVPGCDPASATVTVSAGNTLSQDLRPIC
ncbi:MAG: carboxypeptidase regulatory-like domain-containing protein [Actinomycetota bacterium]